MSRAFTAIGFLAISENATILVLITLSYSSVGLDAVSHSSLAGRG